MLSVSPQTMSIIYFFLVWSFYCTIPKSWSIAFNFTGHSLWIRAFLTWQEAEPRIQTCGLQLLCNKDAAFLTRHWSNILKLKRRRHVVYLLKTLYVACVLDGEAMRRPRSRGRCGPIYCNSQQYTVIHVSCHTAPDPTGMWGHGAQMCLSWQETPWSSWKI